MRNYFENVFTMHVNVKIKGIFYSKGIQLNLKWKNYVCWHVECTNASNYNLLRHDPYVEIFRFKYVCLKLFTFNLLACVLKRAKKFHLMVGLCPPERHKGLNFNKITLVEGQKSLFSALKNMGGLWPFYLWFFSHVRALKSKQYYF